jgi:hypothetical protein
MPNFCRHNHLVQNCPICSREQAVELRPIVSSSAPRSSSDRASTPSRSRPRTPSSGSGAGSRAAGGMRVSRLTRSADDGYQSRLVPGLHSSADAEHLAQELAFAARRLECLAEDPPGLYAEVAGGDGDVEERTWLAFLIAYLCPLDGEDPFSAVRSARTSWVSGDPPALDDVTLGPRSAHQPRRGTRTFEAYRAWTRRAGSQSAAITGDSAWTAERRFARVFERLALPGLHRDARFDLLVTLGWLGVYELRAGALQLGGDNDVTVAAKRALGIGDVLLLERRAAELAQACGLPLEAVDVGLYNWGRDGRAFLGLEVGTEPDPGVLEAARTALGL